jgi:cytochrome P450
MLDVTVIALPYTKHSNGQTISAEGVGVKVDVRCGPRRLPPYRNVRSPRGSPANRRARRRRDRGWAEPVSLSGRDGGQVQVEATMHIHQVVQDLIAQRRKQPANDLLTNPVQAEADGEKLTDLESTPRWCFSPSQPRHHPTHGQFRGQGTDRFPRSAPVVVGGLRGRINSATEEFLRWASVVLNFRRTAVAEYELNGQHIVPGDKVVVMYPSGNRDAEMFDNPGTFDRARQPNPHIAFGGGGIHHCLGNRLAKSMLRSSLRESHLPNFVAGEATLMKANFMRGVVSLQFEPNLVSQP